MNNHSANSAMPPSILNNGGSTTAIHDGVREQVQQHLHQLLRDRCSISDPAKESRVLETMLFRALQDDLDDIKRMDKDRLESKLKGISTKLLHRRMVQRQQKLPGFRRKFVLTIPTMEKTSSKIYAELMSRRRLEKRTPTAGRASSSLGFVPRAKNHVEVMTVALNVVSPPSSLSSAGDAASNEMEDSQHNVFEV